MFKTISDGIFAQLDDAVKAIKATVDAQPDHILWTCKPESKDPSEFFDVMYAIIYSACSGETIEEPIVAFQVENGILYIYADDYHEYVYGDKVHLKDLYRYRLDKFEDINYSATVISILESIDQYV